MNEDLMTSNLEKAAQNVLSFSVCYHQMHCVGTEESYCHFPLTAKLIVQTGNVALLNFCKTECLLVLFIV